MKNSIFVFFFLSVIFFFACKKEKEEEINIYTLGAFDAKASAEKNVGGKNNASWKGLGTAYMDSKEKTPKSLFLQMGTLSEEGFARESIGLFLPIKTGNYTLNSTLSSNIPFCTYGIWGSDGGLLEASYDCDTIKSLIKVIKVDTIANVMNGEFELYFNNFNANNGFPKTASFTKGKFDVEIKRY